MRMGYMAIWSDESVLQRPPSKDRERSQARYAQGPGCPYLRDRDLDCQALRRPKAQRGESLQPGKAPGKHPKMDEQVRKLLEEDLKVRPFVTFRERCDYVEAISGVSVSRSTMCRAIAQRRPSPGHLLISSRKPNLTA